MSVLCFTALLIAEESVTKTSTDLTGKPAPTFYLPKLNGDKFYLSDHINTKQGKKVVVINFFATYCKPCRREMPELDSIIRIYPSDSLLLVFIDAGERKDVVIKSLSDYSITPGDIRDFKTVVSCLKKKNKYSNSLKGLYSSKQISFITSWQPTKANQQRDEDKLVELLNIGLRDTMLYRKFYLNIEKSDSSIQYPDQHVLSMSNRKIMEQHFSTGLVRKFDLLSEEIRWPVLIDQYNNVSEKYNVASFPTTVVIDTKGNIALHITGYTKGNIKILTSVLNSLLPRNTVKTQVKAVKL